MSSLFSCSVAGTICVTTSSRSKLAWSSVKQVLVHWLSLLSPLSHPAASLDAIYKKAFSGNFYNTNLVEEGTFLSVDIRYSEELIAMHLSYVKNLAQSVAGEKVHDVFVTVLLYYSQFERDAVADAIEISGLRTLALINDGSVVAINHAITQSFPTQEYHIIYDAGASSIRATLISFSTDSKTSATRA